jgi:TolB-like protein/Flp pilus assembly protein TadD
MTDNSNKLTQFWQELKRRKVIYVITVYASASFVLIELVNNVLEPLNLPENLSTIVIIALAVAFPIVVILSWIFDVTPKGVEKTKPVDEVLDVKREVASNSWRLATYVSVVIIAGLIIFNVFTRTNIPENLIQYGKSIAVLPFVNDSPDQENEFLINGIMVSILDNLSKIKDLVVISRSSVEQYRDTIVPIQEIARAMEASYILESSIQKIGQRFRISVHLIDQNGRQVWSEQYDREIIQLEEQFSLQSEIAEMVAREIHAVVTPEEKQRMEKIPTTNARALELYQRGFDECLQYLYDYERGHLVRAEVLFRRALDYDSTYANAINGLATVYANIGKRDSSLILVNKALSYDDQLEYAYLMRGNYYYYKGNHEAALENFNTALDINPNLAPAYVLRANSYHWLVNDYVRAIEDYEEAILRNRDMARSEIGLYTVYDFLALTYLEAGFGEQAKPYYMPRLDFDGDSAAYINRLASIEQLFGNYQKADILYRKAYEIDSTKLPDLWNYIYAGQLDAAYKWANKWDEYRPGWNTNAKAYLHWNAGKHDQARDLLTQDIEYIEQILKESRLGVSSGDFHIRLAPAYALLGDKDKAYQMLEELNEIQNNLRLEWVNGIKLNPMFDELREEELFQKIVEHVEARYQAEYDRVKEWLEKTGRL